MNRTIKFRGLRTDGKGWAYGYYVVDYLGITYIQTLDGVDTFEVDPETVGQFTGLYDKNGTEIYEGDVIGDWTDVDGEQVLSRCLVFFDETLGEWMIDVNHGKEMHIAYSLAAELNDFDYEVIGNTTEHKDLLS